MESMKFMISAVCFGLTAALATCVKPTDLIGTWTGPAGATLTLSHDGTFSARALPSRVFLMHDSIDAPINGTGRWTFEKRNLLWHGDAGIVTLAFDDMPGYPPRMGVQVIVSGSGGLYQWKGEEGGERYEMQRKFQ
jgi:hypothetical protein